MHDWQSLSQVRWEGKSQVVIIPKYRKRIFSGQLRRQMGGSLRDLCRHRGVELVEGHCLPAQVQLCLSIPPKDSGAHRRGLLNGKRAVRSQRERLQERRLTGLHFWAVG
jgi:REP-associated tyrosine transposase